MCGIVGYVGDRPCRDLLIAGLEKLEYRGYDSAGVSVISDGEIDSVRAVGNLANLRAAVEEHSRNGGAVAVATPPATIGSRPHALGDARPGHRGERPPPRRLLRQDPHRPQRDRREPRRAAQGARRRRGTSSAPRPTPRSSRHLIERHYDGDLVAAVRGAFAELRGHYAFVAMHLDHPDLLVAARKECPLIVGLGEDENFVASAIPAFLAETRRVKRSRTARSSPSPLTASRSPTPRATRSSATRTGHAGTRTPPRRAATRPS